MSTTSSNSNPSAPGADGSRIKAEVRVTVDGKPQGTFHITNGEHLIGRDPGCEIPIDAGDVSRQHARLTFTGYDFLMENLGSTNGVFVEGSRIELPTPVYAGQEIQIGRAHLRVKLSEEANRELMRALWDADLGLASVKTELKAPRYTMGATIAVGGMGAVLQARDVHIRRIVAMKVMRAEKQFSPENLLRFIDEARLTGQLEHPNIVPMYELGVDDQGRVFYTMKHVKGVNLDEVLRQLRVGDAPTLERYPLVHLLNIFQKVCDAIAFAHSKHVVHRDLKPENIMIGGYGEVLVMDWGLAKIHGMHPHPEAKPAKHHDHAAPHPQLGTTFRTLDGMVVGTPPYLSPEQARGEIDSLDPRTDVYGLGAVLYEILTLRPPIVCTTVEEVLKKTVEGRIDPPTIYNTREARKAKEGEQQILLQHCPGGKIPEAIAAVTMKALRLNPADRYQTVEDLQHEIESFQTGFATSAEKAGLWKQLLLLVRRHKTSFVLLLAAFVLVSVTFPAFMAVSYRALIFEAFRQRDAAKQSAEEAREALKDLHGTAPTFAEDAEQLVDDGRLDDALGKINYAIEQVPNEARYYIIQGNILQSKLKIEDAKKSYEAALNRSPKNKPARDNYEFCKKLLAQSGDNPLTSGQLRALQAAMRSQGRFSEAVAMMEKFERDRTLIQDTWSEFFGKKKGLRGQVTANDDGTLSVEITKTTTPTLSGLRGMPIAVLNLDGTKVTDITALSGLPLKSLNLGRTSVADLSPLRGMKLDRLALPGTRVSDIRPLQGMPLQFLNISGTPVRDLSPLQGAPVRELLLEGCRDLTDLKPLMECAQLEKLLLPVQMRDIEFLRDHPGLKYISYRKIDQPADAFWKEFDAPAGKGKEGGKKKAPPPPK